MGRWETYEALGRYWEQQGGTGGHQGDIGGRGEIGAPSSDGGQRRGLGDSRGFWGTAGRLSRRQDKYYGVIVKSRRPLIVMGTAVRYRTGEIC